MLFEPPESFDTHGTPMATSNMVFAMLGAYAWELCQTMNAEYCIVRSGKARQFPLVPFALCRICTLAALVGNVVVATSRTQLRCTTLYIFNSWAGSTAIVLATILLFHRTADLWKGRRIVKYTLGVLGMVQVALLYTRTFTTVEGVWDTTTGKCARLPWRQPADRAVVLAALFTSTGVQLVALCLAAMPIFQTSVTTRGTLSKLHKIFIVDGWLFFWVVFSINLVQAVFHALPFNSVLRSLATTPAVALTTMAACRLVYNWQYTPPQGISGDSFSHTSVIITGSARSCPSTIAMTKTPSAPQYHRTLSGIRVTTADLAPEELGPYSPPNDVSEDKDDARRRISVDSDSLSLKFATNPV